MAATPGEDQELASLAAIRAADGVLLLGNGPLVRAAGAQATAAQQPLLIVATFGGAAGAVWRALTRSTEDDDSRRALEAMNRPWRKGAATELLSHLQSSMAAQALARAQAKRRRRTEWLRETAEQLIVLLLLILAVATIPIGSMITSPSTSVVLLLLGPMMAAAAGGMARGSINGKPADVPLRAAVQGLLAGTAALLLYVATQLITNPKLFESVVPSSLVSVMVIIGLIAGLTTEHVLAKLRNATVIDLNSLESLVKGEHRYPPSVEPHVPMESKRV